MRRLCTGIWFLLVAVAPVPAAEPSAKVLREVWYECRTTEGKLGHMHFIAKEIERDGKKLIHSTIIDELTYLRSGDPYHEKSIQESIETPAGAVVEFGYTTTLSKKQDLKVRGRPAGKEATLTVVGEDGQGTKFTQQIPWDAAAIGLYAQEFFLKGKVLEPGKTYTMKGFNTSANRVVPTTFTVIGPDTLQLGDEKRELIKVEQSYPKELYLTKTTLWVDKEGLAVRMSEDSNLFGVISHEVKSQDAATSKFKPKVADIEAPITVNKALSFTRGSPKEITIRVSLEGDDAPGTLFRNEPRQQVVKSDKTSVELKLLAKPPAVEKKDPPADAASGEKKEPVPAEYLDSSYFIRTDDPLVQKLTKEAVGDEKDQRKQARLIRRWVHNKVRGNYEVAFATADEVARTLEGDCSEIGVLGAAMLRVVGIPSRVAFGLVYDPGSSLTGKPGFGGHLWAEAYLDGQWETFDPTGVVPLLGAAHLKIADYSLKGVLNPEELVEVRRAFAGKMKMEILDNK